LRRSLISLFYSESMLDVVFAPVAVVFLVAIGYIVGCDRLG
jgi:hypothetical protein